MLFGQSLRKFSNPGLGEVVVGSISIGQVSGNAEVMLKYASILLHYRLDRSVTRVYIEIYILWCYPSVDQMPLSPKR
jgi:hypothetical protein